MTTPLDVETREGREAAQRGHDLAVWQRQEQREDCAKKSSAEDITPELYFYSVLQDHLLYDEMKTVTDEMLKRQPANAEAKELAAYVQSRI